jgi:hypothetical protein
MFISNLIYLIPIKILLTLLPLVAFFFAIRDKNWRKVSFIGAGYFVNIIFVMIVGFEYTLLNVFILYLFVAWGSYFK